MSRHPFAPFPDRLATARRMVARGTSRLAPHVADQLDAATREQHHLHDRLGQVLPMLEPTRNWRQRADRQVDAEVKAYLLAALLGCTTVCIHLRRGGPRPAFARLPYGRIDCARCTSTIYRPITADDECDVCNEKGVVTFVPFSVQQGPVMLAGNACPSCTNVFGINQIGAAS